VLIKYLFVMYRADLYTVIIYIVRMHILFFIYKILRLSLRYNDMP